ncbi:TssQ family T6SS-associated lipoprotein [Bordetella trematum]|uniref:TssQ family T6SS-associated lipoprotein n=1 Tax=Bordetella trematum TaxID=123899 RepID=UPI0020A62E68|nr:TssQ family T6SS-associated lipoprotein [Bordetella trematum]
MKPYFLSARRLGLAALFTALLAGCAHLSRPAIPTEAQQQALARVEADYLAGRYGDVIRRVATSDELAGAPASIQVPALKLQAFSYCVSRHEALCEDAFARILKLDPDFTLTAAEVGHPTWGPAYQRTRR